MASNEILVKFKECTVVSKKEAVFAKLNGKLKEKILIKMMEKQNDKNGTDCFSFREMRYWRTIECEWILASI